MCIRLLLATTLALALGGAPAAQPDAAPEPQPEPFEGVALDTETSDGPPLVFRFEFDPDQGVILESLGSVEVSTRPDPLGRMPALPMDNPEARIAIPEETFLFMAEMIEEKFNPPPPEQSFGISVDGGRFQVSLAQGGPLLTLAAAAAGIALLTALIVTGVFMLRERRRKNEHLRLQRRQAEAREAERVRLAREIHDGPLQDLHALRATLATSSGDGAPALTPGVPSLDHGIGGVAHELRAIAEGLRPPALGRFGLAAALGAHATRFRERHPHVELRLELDDDGGARGSRLSESARATLFRVAQEAMSNAVQHGGARTVEIRLALRPTPDDPAEVVLEVQDDGVGLGGAPDLDALTEAGHFGLVGMHERAALLDGRLEMGPAPSRGERGSAGTLVHLAAPWESVSAASAV